MMVSKEKLPSLKIVEHSLCESCVPSKQKVCFSKQGRESR